MRLQQSLQCQWLKQGPFQSRRSDFACVLRTFLKKARCMIGFILKHFDTSFVLNLYEVANLNSETL